MKTMLSLFIGFAGFILLICETETLLAFVLSKIIAVIFLSIAYRLFKLADANGEIGKIKKLFNDEQ